MLKRALALLFAAGMASPGLSPCAAQTMNQGPIRSIIDSRGVTLAGVTTNGAGQAVAPADKARVSLQLIARNNLTTLNAQTLQPVVDALIRAHVDPKSIVEPVYLTGPGQSNAATLAATVEHPTVQMMQDGMQTLVAAFNNMPNVIVQQAFVVVTVDDCRQIRSRARRQALDRAHAQAVELAQESGVALGKIVAVTSFGESGPSSTTSMDACSSSYQLGPGNYPPFNSLSDFLQVRVFSNVTATYAIR